MSDPNRKTRTATLADVLGAQNNMKLYTDAKLKDTIAGYHGMIATKEAEAVERRLAALEAALEARAALPWWKKVFV